MKRFDFELPTEDEMDVMTIEELIDLRDKLAPYYAFKSYSKRQAEIGMMICDGKTLHEAALSLNITTDCAKQHLNKYKIKKKYNQLIQDYLDGQTIEELAQLYKYPLITVEGLVAEAALQVIDK